MLFTTWPFDTCVVIAAVNIGFSAGLRSGKMKCVNSATPGPMKMNQAINPAIGTRLRSAVNTTRAQLTRHVVQNGIRDGDRPGSASPRLGSLREPNGRVTPRRPQ